ncbi:MAG TPA: HIRAN domain-containing protein, partial [Actinomycetota bacterium]|nr:HIRAN domain-containing protein [Actinomycetota bacterium]
MLFRRRARVELRPPDTPADWASGAWRDWDPPLNVVTGEAYRQRELQALAGPPRENGWLVPVEACLVRERRNPHDPNAIRVEVRGLHVGYIARGVAQ